MRPDQLETDSRPRVLIQIPELEPVKRSRRTFSADWFDSLQDGPESDRIEEPLSASAWRRIKPQYVSAGLGLIFVILLFVMQPGRSNHPASTGSNEALKKSVSSEPDPEKFGTVVQEPIQFKSDENRNKSHPISNDRKSHIRVVTSDPWLEQKINLTNRHPMESRPEFMDFPITLPQKSHSPRQQNEPRNEKSGIYIDRAAEGMRYYEVRQRARQNMVRRYRTRTDQGGVARFQNRIETPPFRARHDRTEQGLY